MKFTSSSLSLVFFFFFLLCLSSTVRSQTNHGEFLRCLSLRLNGTNLVSSVVHTRNDSSFSSVLLSSIQNPRFSSPETPKPVLIITPVRFSHVQSAILCARRHGVRVRTRSGGHDYEGLSYVSGTDFIVIDLMNLRSVSVDVENRTAWVQTGATIGELYHEIARKDRSLGFPAGVCPTVGVGGHFSGGGYGTLLRKHGLAADNVIDAHVIDARGRFLDRQSMGEEFFWAIRGGGGSSFAVVLSWKIRLVHVPPTVTVFNVSKTSEQNAIKIIDRWQFIAGSVSNDLFIRVMLQRSNKTAVLASFPGLYLGPTKDLLPLMEQEFPELGLEEEDCTETSWIESVVWFAEFPEGESIDVLTRRTRGTLSFKAKSDFVEEPMSETAIRELWRRLYAPEAELAQLIFTPFGGKMSEIAENESPFPHRAGNIYEIQYLVYWRDGEEETKNTENYIRWVESAYEFMTPFVSKSPRGAYINLRDLDLGMYSDGIRTRYEEARSWGVKYFKSNFYRLVRVKTAVDPSDFFRDEQSVPPLTSVSEI
ncbi:PREDICTED: cannabidiolic acid synthase-like 1 [Tarenaya hassleriana]|uniref:cannabidiolic acid synthase-like 1 n=1 Tax=Tarenaya hassleriana TaxID=28532 RepID=UPI00053C827F|nr:PREDICTED: cannabidiolic acid synthase-like 1 [Tarenaya hassleriana]